MKVEELLPPPDPKVGFGFEKNVKGDVFAEMAEKVGDGIGIEMEFFLLPITMLGVIEEVEFEFRRA